MSANLYSYILTIIGLLGFFLAGKKVWWCWYVNLLNQGLWLGYSIWTEQWGFLFGAFLYTAIFMRNAVEWTIEHVESKQKVENESPV